MAPAEITSSAAASKDDWTFVKPKKWRNGRQAKPRQPEGEVHHEAQVNRDESTLRSPEEIRSEYNRVLSQYEKEPACTALKRVVREMQPKPITRGICLGIGTFDPPDGGWDTKRRTYLQLWAFITMVEALEERQDSGRIECFFQEPLFTKPDCAFIESLSPSFRVVDSPEGFEKVNPTTFLYGLHLYRPIYAKALAKAAPSIFVGTSLDVWDTVSFGQASEFLRSPNVETIESTYRRREFPSGDSTAFSSTSIYWADEGDCSASPGDCGVDEVTQLAMRLQAAATLEGKDEPSRDEGAT